MSQEEKRVLWGILISEWQARKMMITLCGDLDLACKYLVQEQRKAEQMARMLLAR